MVWQTVAERWDVITVWGLVATGVMATVLEGAQLIGISRMSLPFLFGAFVTGRRRRAIILGYVLYLIGGWVFAWLYAFVMTSIGISTWWMGLLIGLAHGLFLITIFLPLLPVIHPRMATEYDGPSALGRLEPPGYFGLHYGGATPASTVLAQLLFGVIFGLGFSP